MALAPLDWVIVAAYVVLAMSVGVAYSRRASRDPDEFFLSGRNLPWWLAGTSMVATTFASDTPLVVTGWVREDGIWKNWIWWCLAIGTALTVFLFARYWRRGRIMTTAELSELRYSGREASVLRGFLGVYQALITNTIVLVWVVLAARKTMEALLPIDRTLAVGVACAIALSYSLLSGLWGVVVTDFLQFAMAMIGAIVLAAIAWAEIGGAQGVAAAVESGVIGKSQVAFMPPTGEGGLLDGTYWTAPITALAVYLGVAWWAKDGVDGGGLVVQRIAAARDERQGVLATLWYMIGTWAVRPWPWILVALASLIVLPAAEVRSPVAGRVQAVASLETTRNGGEEARSGFVQIETAAGTERVEWAREKDWGAEARVEVGDQVAVGDLLAETDAESAYPVMMRRFLPTGLLGLVVASLVAAFMSTVDTHLNLASSFFVNDVYRRFLARDRSSRHYVQVGRVACVGVMLLAGWIALRDLSIADLFTFFLSFLGGVGAVYLLRWAWWRVRATTELSAMIASSVSTVYLTIDSSGWKLGPLSPGGELGHEGRLVLVVLFSLTCALASMLFTKAPNPADLVPFYRRVQPLGFWGPVRRLANVSPPRGELTVVLAGVAGSLALTFGLLFAVGLFLLGREALAGAWLAAAVAGAIATAWSLRNLPRSADEVTPPTVERTA